MISTGKTSHIYVLRIHSRKLKLEATILKRPRHRQNNIKMDMKAVRCERMDWIQVVQY